MYKIHNKQKYFAAQLFSKFHQIKLRNKRAGDDLRCSKSLSQFSQNKKSRDGPPVLKSDQLNSASLLTDIFQARQTPQTLYVALQHSVSDLTLLLYPAGNYPIPLFF